MEVLYEILLCRLPPPDSCKAQEPTLPNCSRPRPSGASALYAAEHCCVEAGRKRVRSTGCRLRGCHLRKVLSSSCFQPAHLYRGSPRTFWRRCFTKMLSSARSRSIMISEAPLGDNFHPPHQAGCRHLRYVDWTPTSMTPPIRSFIIASLHECVGVDATNTTCQSTSYIDVQRNYVPITRSLICLCVSLALSLPSFPLSLSPSLSLSVPVERSLSLSLFLFPPSSSGSFQQYQTSDTPRSIEVICTHRQGKVLTLDREAKAAAGISARMPKTKPLRTALLDFCRRDLQVLW